MNHSFLIAPFSLLCPWLGLIRFLQVIVGYQVRPRGLIRLSVLAVAAVGILAVPVNGFTIGGWIRGIEANFSIPLTALLAVAVWEKEFSKSLLNPTDKLAGWAFGFVGGLILYPMALGLGYFDPYTWGWNFSPLFVWSAALTVLLVWKGNRLGVIMLISILAYHLRLLESTNYWDYLLDPVYFVVGLLMLVRWLLTRTRQTGNPAPQPNPIS